MRDLSCLGEGAIYIRNINPKLSNPDKIPPSKTHPVTEHIVQVEELIVLFSVRRLENNHNYASFLGNCHLQPIFGAINGVYPDRGLESWLDRLLLW